MADEIAAALDLAAGSWDWSSGISMNSAFVFIKPHANNEKVKEFVKAQLVEAGLSINYEGVMTGPEIAKAKIIDKRKFFDKFNCGNYIGFLRQVQILEIVFMLFFLLNFSSKCLCDRLRGNLRICHGENTGHDFIERRSGQCLQRKVRRNF